MSSCASYDVSKITPHFVDPDKMVTREYHVVQSKPEIKFEFTKENSISDAVKKNGGLACLPVPQFLDIKRAYEKYARSKNKTQNEPDYLIIESTQNKNSYPRSIQEELEVIDGIPILQNTN